jgi:hypothetical protein
VRFNVGQGPAGTAGAITAMIVLLTTTAGCTSGNGTAPAATSSRQPSSNASASGNLPPVTDVPRLLDSANLKLPLDAYLWTPDEVDQASKAHRELIRRCMRRFGASITIPEPPTGPGPKTRNERRYGLTDPVAAAQVGYGFPDAEPPTRPSGTPVGPTLTAKSRAVLTGEGQNLPSGLPKGGCSTEARRRLTPVDPSTKKPLDEDLPQRLSLDSFQRSQEDPRVRAAFADWSQCMQKKGHQYQKPFDPLADPEFRPAGTTKERGTAEDDVACKASTNLVGRWYAVEFAYQRLLITQHTAKLTVLAQAQPAVKRLVQTLNRRR